MARDCFFAWLNRGSGVWKRGALAAATAFGICGLSHAQLQVYVATNGKDIWSGNLPAPNQNLTDGPKKTLEGARDKLRLLRNANQFPAAGAIINVQPGVYPRTQSFQLGPTDGGSAQGPVIYRSTTPKAAILEGGIAVTGWVPVNGVVRTHLKASVRNLVKQINLRSLGITDYGYIKKRRFGEIGDPAQMELFYNDQALRLAQFPNSGWKRTAVVSGKSFKAQGGLPIRAWPLNDIWFHGFPMVNYAEEWNPITSVGFDQNWTNLTDMPKYGLTTNARFQLVNVLSELDSPGEYYIDRILGIVYFYSVGGPPNLRSVVSMLETPVLATYQTQFLKFEGFTVSNSRGDGLYFNQGNDVSAVNCLFKNLGGTGVNTNALRTTFLANDFVDIGQVAINVAVGNRVNLASGEAVVSNNWVERSGRIIMSGAPAINLTGVGITATNNLIRNVPYQAIKFAGNFITISKNDIAYACLQTGDDGAIYSGRDFTYRGNVIFDNLIRDVRALQQATPEDGSIRVNAIYLDDFLSGTNISSNAFVRCDVGVQVGGGRDNTVQSNVFYQCNTAVSADSRGQTHQTDAMNQGGTLLTNLLAVPYTQPPYSTNWPELATIMGDSPLVAKRNNFNVNVAEQNVLWLWTDGHFSVSLNPFTLNRVNQSVGFANPAAYNFSSNNGQLLADGYIAPNAATAGIVVDQYRSWIPGK